MANPIKLQADVVSVDSFGNGVYQVRLKPLGRVPRFRAGQFLHLALDDFDPSGGFWPESRVFSIASGYGEDLITIVYSVKGQYTRRMENNLIVGSTKWLKLPFGDFTIEGSLREGQDAVLIAGGTGVSPYIPYLQEIARSSSSPSGSIHLYYGIRENSMILFRDLLAQCAKIEGFSLDLRVENEEPCGLGIEPARVRRGRLDIREILLDMGRLENPVFFLSGPPGMIRSFRSTLADLEVSASNIKSDDWE